MPKFTYPIVFIFNEEAGVYNGFIPDLCLYVDGKTLEEVYAEAEGTMHDYFKLCTMYSFDYHPPSGLEEVSKKWKGFKVSLLTASVPDVD